MCFQSQCMNMKVIKICLEEYQTMTREVRIRFVSEIQEFEEFRKLMKEELLDMIAYTIL